MPSHMPLVRRVQPKPGGNPAPGPVLVAGLLPLLALALVSCRGAKVEGESGATGGGSGGSGPGMPARPGGLPGTGGQSGGALPPAGQPGVSPDAATCAEESHQAQVVPVDLLLLVDASQSMSSSTGTESKHALVRRALLRFIREPQSAGLGLGLQFFPLPSSGSTCDGEAVCGFPTGGLQPPACQPLMVCQSSLAADEPTLCGGRFPDCNDCVPLGRCSESLADCTNVGQPCATGASDLCQGLGSVCQTSSGETVNCRPETYGAPTVPIVASPAPAERLVARAFGLRGADGTTPMRPAVQGALDYLKTHAATHPGRKVALILATDGVPNERSCQPNTVADVAMVLDQGQAAAIATYVIGVANQNEVMSRAAFAQLASAGGTGQPYLLTPTDDLAEKLTETLAQIRGQALPCEFAIPAATAGAIDYGKVNLGFKGAAGSVDVLYAGSADRCDPMNGGWYYDVDPASGAKPTRIIVCPATCARFKAEPSATVDLRFGCQTRTID